MRSNIRYVLSTKTILYFIDFSSVYKYVFTLFSVIIFILLMININNHFDYFVLYFYLLAIEVQINGKNLSFNRKLKAVKNINHE